MEVNEEHMTSAACDTEATVLPSGTTTNLAFSCKFCDKSFARKYHLKRHVIGFHRRWFQPDCAEGDLKCQETNCSKTFRYLEDFARHLKLAHKKELEKEILIFPSTVEFLAWKREMEMATKTLYVTRRQPRSLRDGTILSEYRCHRSGIYKTKGQNRRQLKTQGTQKIGFRCTSSLTVHERHSQLTVTFHKTHYGHKNELQHLRLTPEEKCALAAKMSEGVPFHAILEAVRSSVDGDLKRIHLSTSKDLHNIAAEFGLNNFIRKHNINAANVYTWVEEMKQMIYGGPGKDGKVEMEEELVEEVSSDGPVQMEGEIIDVSSSILSKPAECECSVCGHSFRSKMNLLQHARKAHGIRMPRNWQKYECLICTPPVYFAQLSGLRKHHVLNHDYVDEVRTLRFGSREEFTKWKEGEEQQTHCYFLSQTGVVTLQSGRKKQFYLCNRACEIFGKKGGNGIGQQCLATMELVEPDETTENHQINVVYHCNHFGHDFDSSEIETSEGASCNSSLDKSQHDNSYQLNHLARQRERRANFVQHVLLARDMETLDSWLEKSLVQGDQSPILYCKECGVEEGPEETEDRFEAEDFFLVLSNQLQRELLAQFGSSVVCVDCVDTGVAQELALTAVVILDEFEEPFPVAFCLSNRIDFTVFKRFFRCLQVRVGSVVSSVLVSNDMPALYEAWGHVMGECEHHQLCPWYTEKCWKKLLEMFPAAKKSKHTTICRMLKGIMRINDIERFSKELDTFMRKMSREEDTSLFTLHFRDQFSVRPEMWAFCYLGSKWGEIADRLELMHRALRKSFSLGKDFTRIVRCITSLCRMVRDRNSTRLSKMEEGIDDAQGLEDTIGIVVEIVEENCHWRLQDNWGESFQVQKILESSGVEDSYRNYLCSCMENLAYSKCCQHITTVMQLQQNQSPSHNTSLEQERLISSELQNSEVLSAPLTTEPSMEYRERMTKTVEEKVSSLLDFVKKRKLTTTDLEKTEKQIDVLLNEIKTFSSVQSAESQPVAMTLAMDNGVSAYKDGNTFFVICPASLNVKVPISRYRSPLAFGNNYEEMSSSIEHTKIKNGRRDTRKRKGSTKKVKVSNVQRQDSGKGVSILKDKVCREGVENVSVASSKAVDSSEEVVITNPINPSESANNADLMVINSNQETSSLALKDKRILDEGLVVSKLDGTSNLENTAAVNVGSPLSPVPC